MDRLRCAAWARAEQVDPIGTAGSYAGFCCVEWPLPWPRDIGEVAELAALVAATATRKIRLQGLVPRSGGPDQGAGRVMVYRRPAGDGFAGYERTEATCGPDDMVATALSLLDGAATADARAGTDVLVCTHGRRDVCCGSRGAALATELESGDALGPAVRLHRTSHTGGHRFAPTAIVLPQGTLWAFLDASALGRILRREGPLDDLLPRYRGCAGLASPVLQALERAVLVEVGWELFASRRLGQELGDGRARLEVVSPGGTRRAWEAEVLPGRLLPVPDCGRPVSEAKKAERELVVSGVRRIS